MHARNLCTCAVLALSVALPSRQALADPALRPNIVLILADDLGSFDVGWRGSDIKTPHLDKLALAGARLDQFYVQPVCSPTRAALMTGRYPFRYGLQVGVVRPWAEYGLSLNERLLPQALHQAGYQTAIVGKWHLGHFRGEYLPTRRGFDHQYGHYNGALDYFTHVRDEGFDWHRDDQECRDEGYSTHLIAREAVQRIERRDPARPLFLYVPFNAAHSPLQVPASYSAPYEQFSGERRVYAGMVTAMDEAVGQIAAAIDRQGLTPNTLFLFSSDNGGPKPGLVTSNGSLRAGKGTLYEGGTRVCAFANWPGHIPPTAIDAPMHIVDWYATLLRLAGAATDQQLAPDGVDQWPVLTGRAASGRDEVVLNIAPRGGALRSGTWKLVLNGERSIDDGEPSAGGRNRRAAAGRVELFDLATDKVEQRNLAESRPEIARKLQARYDALAAQASPPLSRPKPAGFRSPKVWGQPD